MFIDCDCDCDTVENNSELNCNLFTFIDLPEPMPILDSLNACILINMYVNAPKATKNQKTFGGFVSCK